MKKLALIAALALPLAAWADQPRGTTTPSDKSQTTDRTNDNNTNVPSNKSGTDKAQTSSKEKLSDSDLQDMAFVHHVNQEEISLGKVAQMKGSTQAVKDYAVEYLGVDPDQVTVVRRGRDLERLGEPSPERRAAARAALGVGDDEVLILSVGRHEFQKGQIHLVEAMPEVLRHHPEAVVLVAGRDGAVTGQLEAAIARLGLADKVRLLGYRDDVEELLHGADVLAFLRSK